MAEYRTTDEMKRHHTELSEATDKEVEEAEQTCSEMKEAYDVLASCEGTLLDAINREMSEQSADVMKAGKATLEPDHQEVQECCDVEKAEQDAMDEQRELCDKNRERIEGAARGVSRERIRAGLERVMQEAEQSSQEFDAEGETIAESIETTDQEVLEQEQRAADLVQNPPEF